jgi:hypothetical protein
LADVFVGQEGFEAVASASATGEAGGVVEGVVRQCRCREAVYLSSVCECVGDGVAVDDGVGGDRECVAGVVV